MKRYLFFVLLLFITKFADGQTNVYQPYPSDSVATAVYYEIFTGSGSTYHPSTGLRLGDTLINGIHYNKCYSRNDWNGTPVVYVGGFRQDIPNEKVYSIDLQNIEHDISVSQHLVVGDSLNGLPIITVDSVLWGNNYHKRYQMYKFDSVNQEEFISTWVAGVGITHSQTSGFEHGSNQYIICQKVGNTMNFQLFPYNICDQLVGIFEKETPKEAVNVYPNPVLDKLTIEINNTTGDCIVSVLNVNGQELIRQQIKENRSEINLTKLSGGIYFVKLIDGKSVLVRKIIKE